MTKIKNITDALEATVIMARTQAPSEAHEAIGTFNDLIANAYEEIDAFNEDKGGIESLYLDGEIPAIPARALRECLMHFGREDVAVVVELAEKHHLALPKDTEITVFDEDNYPVTMPTGEALALTLCFIARHMEELFTQHLGAIELTESYFQAA